MKPVTVFGIGSPFGADRLGWQAIDVLAYVDDWPVPIICHKLDRPGLALLERLREVERAVLIDAFLAREKTGVRVLSLDELAVGSPLTTHDAGLAETLALGERLGMLPGELVIVGIGVVAESMDEDVALPMPRFMDVMRGVLTDLAEC